MNIRKQQAGGFADTEPAAVDKLVKCPVTDSQRRAGVDGSKQGINLLHAQHLGQRTGSLGAVKLQRKVFRPDALAQQKLAEGTQGRNLLCRIQNQWVRIHLILLWMAALYLWTKGHFISRTTIIPTILILAQ